MKPARVNPAGGAILGCAVSYRLSSVGMNLLVLLLPPCVVRLDGVGRGEMAWQDLKQSGRAG